MRFEVLLTDAAAQDVREIFEFIFQNDSPAAANHVLDNLEKIFLRLEELPNRGSHPKELFSLGVKEYRELFFKPYRIIYAIGSHQVHVHLVADGRRGMQTLLSQRLLER